MSHRQKEHTFDFNGDIQEPNALIKNPKSNRTKFIKDLNHKSNVLIRSEKNGKLNENSRQKDYIIKKSRSRKNSSIQIGSLLERIIPGARILRGEWKDQKLNGEVDIQYDNGNKFVGKYQNGVRIQGKMTYSDLNCQYQGSFFAEKFSGYGKLSYQGGRVIQGEWDNMQFIGNATITYPNKDVYYGPVDQKLYKHGQGYLFLHNGYKYIGSFKHGSITGVGSYFKDDKLIMKGQWLKGKLVKQIQNGDESQGLQALISPKQNRKQQQLKQSTKQKFAYQFKAPQQISYRPQIQNSSNSFVSQTQYMSSLKHTQQE